MRRFEPPDDWERVPGLGKQVQELVGESRYRTAMDEVLRHLRRDPSSTDALYLALTILNASRTDQIESREPLTEIQRGSALLAPLTTECSSCKNPWYSWHVLMPGMKLHVTNPAGAQCQVCRYSLCRRCLGLGQLERLERRCPASGCRGWLTVPVLPTGRSDVSPMDPDGIERVIVARDGPVRPTMEEALTVVTGFVPIVTNDAPLIRIRASVPGMMADRQGLDRLAAYLVHGLEREGELAPGAWERSRPPLFLRPATRTDTDYLVTVVHRPGPQHESDWRDYVADRMADHLRRVVGAAPNAGRCWSGLGSDAMATATAELLHQGLLKARRTNDLVTRTCAIDGYAIAATVVLTPDIAAARDRFDGGYLGLCDELLNQLRDTIGDRDRQTFVHWIMSIDGSMVKLDASVVPGDRSESALLAVDLMTPAERQSLGL